MAAGSSLLKKLALAIASVIVSFGSAELFLRQFEYAKTGPMRLQYSGFDPMKDISVDDPDTLWILQPSQAIEFSGIRFSTSTVGTRGELPEKQKSSDTFRILCLGDSTAFGNWTTYPDELRAILSEHSDRKIEVINGGIPGFSARQGYELFLRDLAAYRPDVITWCFGFNNAKESAGGVSDATRIAGMRTTLGRLRFELSKLRVFRVIQKRVAGLRPQDRAFSANDSEVPLRCTPSEHADVLARMIEWCAANGTKFVPVTQPHAYRATALATPGALDAELGKLIAKRLDEQNEAVRTTATRAGVALIDMAKEFESIDSFEPFTAPFPGNDSIHHNALGIRAFAEIMAGKLSDLGLVPTRSKVEIPHPTVSFPFALGCDLEGDALEEIVIGTVSDRLRLAIFDPRRRTTRTLEYEIPIPTLECAVQRIPFLPDPIVVSTPCVGGFRLDTLTEQGAPGSIHAPFAFPGDTPRTLRVTPFDSQGDGKPEYVVDFGSIGSERLVVCSQFGSPILTWNNPLDRKRNLSVARFRFAGGKDQILISGLAKGLGAVFKNGETGYPVLLSRVDYMLHDVPCIAIAGDFDESLPGDELAVLRGSTLVTKVASPSDFTFSFPLGSLRFDLTRPTLSATALPDADGKRRRLLIASRTERGVDVVVVDREGIRPFAFVPIPEGP